MKISLWRQFSSNHSASFTIVGKFPTAEETQKAAAELKRIVDSLHAWWQAYPEAERDAILEDLRDSNTLTLPEQALKTQYDLENFTQTLDWTPWVNGERVITTFRDLVIMEESTHSNWSGEPPFDDIFRKLGAIVSVATELTYTAFDFNIRWTTPDQETTDAIWRDIQIISHSTYGGYVFRLPEIGYTAEMLTINHNGFELRDIDVMYRDDPLEVAIEKVITFFESRGCTDITYDFSENR